MVSKIHLLAFFILLSSWVFVGFSQGLGEFQSLLQGGGAGSASLAMDSSNSECMKKLIPCHSSLKDSSSTPPATCCTPLKAMIAHDTKCVCDIFNNPTLLKSLNVTQDDALNLAKSCGANVDVSICKKDGTAPPSSETAPAPTKASSNSSSTPSDSTSNSTTSAASGINVSTASGFAAVLVALLFSAS